MSGGSSRLRAAAVRATGEVLAAAALFAAAGAWPTPDINESVYLTKALHRADPAWCRGDFFLETPDAHGVFFVAFGPLIAALPPDSAAWVGRILGWLALAAGFRHAIAPLVDRSWARILAAAIFSMAVRYTPAAGEWVIGGCEAKVFAWAALLAGVGEVVRGRHAIAWVLCGAGAAVHPVVGGWGMVVVAATWLAGHRRDQGPSWRGVTSPGVAPTAWLVVGVALAACGAVPAARLSADADAATRAAANLIYVVERLPHHLLPRSFAAGLVARHLLAIAVWWLLARDLPATAPRRRLTLLVGATLMLSLVGWLVSLAEPWAPAVVHGVLRFYWFRLADGIVPLALAATVAAILEDDGLVCRVIRVTPAVVRGVVVVALGLDLGVEAVHWPLPGRAVVSRADLKVDARAWADACAWVRDHVPSDACFLTPRASASFLWRTGRREVVCWKNSPQDARSLVEWRRRIVDCLSPDDGITRLGASTAAFGADRMRAVAARYGATHAIVPLDTCGLDALPFPRLYANAGFAVLRLEPLTAAARPGDRP